MKKRLSVVLVIVFLALVGFGIIILNGNQFVVGRLWKQEGSYMIVNEEDAMYMNVSESMKNKLDKMSTGDEILLMHGFVETSYPAITDAKFVLKLSQGDEGDLPQGTLDRFVLSDVVLDSNVDSDMIVDVPASVVECEYEGYWFTLEIPENWKYEIQEFTEEDYYDFGLYFWPKDEKEGRIGVLSTEMFAVCGTGLETKKVMFGDFEANQGTYDGNDVWDFMTFSFEDRDFVALNEGMDVWWTEYGEEAMNILSTIEVYDELH